MLSSNAIYSYNRERLILLRSDLDESVRENIRSVANREKTARTGKSWAKLSKVGY
ncbi:hypothetical protein YC2023_109160 [Brassica napus]